MKKSLTLKSYAKVNIGLRIVNKRSDGYHNIQSVFQEISFYDTISLTKTTQGCEFSSNVDWLKNDTSNLCVQAWNIFSDHYKIPTGVTIELNKNIPAGGGLGGGSSNAATILTGLNTLYGLNATESELMSFGKSLGADVPFFIQGGTQLGEGIGEILTPIENTINGTYLLVIPDISIDTSQAYTQIKKHLDREMDPHNFANLFQGDESPLELFENDFELVVIPTYPEIGRIKELIQAYGAKYTSLSGSGSTVFGIFDEEADAIKAESEISSEYRTVLTYPIQRLL